MRYIDLFAGAGGLSEGFTRAGFEAVAHVEMNQDACFTIKTRLVYHYLKDKNKLDIYADYLKGKITRDILYEDIPEEILVSVINEQISDATIESIFSQIDALNGDKKIDLIVGGPPCQAYSVAGRGRIKDLNEKKQDNEKQTDERYFLFRQYVKFLEKYQPNIFVFENVTGLVTAGDGVYLEEMCQEFEKIGYEVNIHLDKKKNTEKVDVFDTSNYGVLQSRKRVIVVGCKEGFTFDMSKFKIDTTNFNVKKDLLEDLPSLQPNDGHRTADYTKEATDYQKNYCIRDTFFDFTTQHITRPNNQRDLEIYKIAIELWLNSQKRLKYSDLREELKTHKNQYIFSNRFQVVNPFGVSHTVVAHISCDGHYYIYPDLEQIRSISMREAARIQSFPDNFFFEGSRTSVFKQIGNAVPPVFAFQIAEAVKESLNKKFFNRNGQLNLYGQEPAKTIRESELA